MYLRCAQCRASNWVRPLLDGEPHAIECQSCATTFTARADERIGFDPREQHQNARKFAESHQIDLPSAYSVLLGVAPLDRMVRDDDPEPDADVVDDDADAAVVAEAEPLAERPQARPVVAGGRRRSPYDAGFRDAVERGFLTVQQATQRGKREAYAAKIARRHRIPLRTAFMVADNEITIREALQQKEEAQKAVEDARQPKRRKSALGPGQKAAAFTLAAVMLGAVGSYAWMLWKQEVAASQAAEARSAELDEAVPASGPSDAEQPQAAETARGPVVEIDRDEEGRITRVVGPDPQSVLDSFCETGDGLQPLKLAAVAPRYAGARLGVFRDFNNLESYFAIRIRRDSRTRRWVVGDGHEPIRPAVLDQVPSDDDDEDAVQAR